MTVIVECDCDGGARDVVRMRGWRKVAVRKYNQSFIAIQVIDLNVLEGNGE